MEYRRQRWSRAPSPPLLDKPPSPVLQYNNVPTPNRRVYYVILMINDPRYINTLTSLCDHTEHVAPVHYVRYTIIHIIVCTYRYQKKDGIIIIMFTIIFCLRFPFFFSSIK